MSVRCLLLFVLNAAAVIFPTEVSGLSMKQYHINLLSSELRQLMLATQESERKVICQAEAAGKLGGILQFSTCESYFVFWRELMSDQAQPFSTHYISCVESLVKPYQSKRNVYKLLF